MMAKTVGKCLHIAYGIFHGISKNMQIIGDGLKIFRRVQQPNQLTSIALQNIHMF